MSATDLSDALVPSFTVCVEFADPVVLHVEGDLDALGADRLRLVLVALNGGGHLQVAVDLAGCGYIGASALRPIVEVAKSLEAAGGRLTIRSPSVTAMHLMTLAGHTDLYAGGDDAAPSPPMSRRAMRVPEPDDGAHPRVPALRATAAVPASDEVVDGSLRLVVAMAASLVGGADGVSVSLRRHGELTTVAATDETISAMDAGQYATGEGPCVDASAGGRSFLSPVLEREQRWPAFTPRALALGINAILSSPLLASGSPVGALNIYSRRADAFGPEDQRRAATLASETSAILTAAGVDITDETTAARLHDALDTRHLVALAQGVLMERSGGDQHDAYTKLRRYSVRTGQPLRERAIDIVASTGPEAHLWGRSGPDDA